MSFFVIVSVLNAKNDSAIFDETAHIPAGYSYLTQHDMRLNPEHPPLLKDLAAVPLLFLHLNFDTNQKFWTDDVNGEWDAGNYLFYHAGNNPDAILFWARLPIIIISVIFGLFLFMWGREIAGITGGLFILMLYAFDPNILGHNHYVTTDVGIAAFMTFSAYFFLKFIKNPTWKNTIIGGIFLGLVHLTKFSSVILLPIFGLVLIIYPLVKKLSYDKDENNKLALRAKTFGWYFLKGLVAFAISIVIIWILYYLNTYKMPADNLAKTIETYFPASDTNPTAIYANRALVFMNGSNLKRPLGEYLLGVFMVFKRVAGGNGAYFMGKVSNQAFLAYFPVVFIIKETIPFLFLIILSLGYAAIRFIKAISKSTKENWKEKFFKYMQTGVVQYSSFAFIILYLYLSITGNLNIGLRHLFPILPFAYLLVTKTVFDFLKNTHIVTRKAFHWAASILVLWIVAIPVFAYPGYVSYFNETIGGSQNGYKYVTDSNTDWGQDLKRLKIYIDEHPEISNIRVDYFGGGDTSYYLGDKFTPWSDTTRPIEAGWYAISTNYLQGSIYDTSKPDDESYRWTKQFTPVAMVGNSILIYHIETPPVE